MKRVCGLFILCCSILSILTVASTYAYSTSCEQAVTIFNLDLAFTAPYRMSLMVTTPSNATTSNATSSEADFADIELINDL